MTRDLIKDIPPYAILSHTWSTDPEDEVTFRDLTDGTGQNNFGYRNKPGYTKLLFCAEQTRRDGLRHFWIDTCCIDKSNNTELSEAINSMFRWYKNAVKCYVYLPDVSKSSFDPSDNSSQLPWKIAFRKSKWFTRGWTLQELIAPTLVEFFSQEGLQLGSKTSLEQLIYEITKIPSRALQGHSLSDFSIEERSAWAETRKTTREEDKAYSLLGIFNVSMPLIYGEGREKAFRRLLEEARKILQAPVQMEKEDQECIQHLRVTDPRDDKKRIEETKGGLLEDSYRWIFETSDFQQWHNNQQHCVLWIKGDPGKGKTMLLCGIIDKLRESMAGTDLLSYFFCQATDSRINNATAVLRGLLYLLVDQQPSLLSYIRKKYDHARKTLFTDANAWVALSEIFTNILQDPSLNNTYLIIDALDECLTDLPRLLDFIVQKSSISSRVKWIFSSRNDPNIERRLRLDDSGTRLSLELKENAEQVSHAVDIYIDHCVSELTELQYDIQLRNSVREQMQQKANGTFLWVSLVMNELKEVESWQMLQVLDEMPSDLKDVYRRMIEQIKQSPRQYPQLCRQVLSVIIAIYRPLHVQELHVLSGLPTQGQNINQFTMDIVKRCGSFLTIQDDHVYIIHQSATDFLSEDASSISLLGGIGNTHHSIFSRSLEIMSETLQRDVYRLKALGCPIEQLVPPDPDPLTALRYSCVYWVDHLYDWNSSSGTNHDADFQNGGSIDAFMRKKYVHWLEALSLCRSIPRGVISMAKLETLIQVIPPLNNALHIPS